MASWDRERKVRISEELEYCAEKRDKEGERRQRQSILHHINLDWLPQRLSLSPFSFALAPAVLLARSRTISLPHPLVFPLFILRYGCSNMLPPSRCHPRADAGTKHLKCTEVSVHFKIHGISVHFKMHGKAKPCIATQKNQLQILTI
jgi:hypothetical protein